MTPSDIIEIVRAGLKAPSADNKHAFVVRPVPGGLAIEATEDFLQAPYHRKILHLVAFGAVVENMRLRAATLGYKLDVQSAELATSAAPAIARLRETLERPLDVPAFASAIEGRTTNRRLRYRGPALAREALAEFERLAEGCDGVTLRFLDHGQARRRLLRLITLAEGERFRNPSLHRDLFSAVRFDVGWRRPTEVGLPPAALGVEPGARWAFSQLRRWSVMRVLRHIGGHRLLGLRSAGLPARLAPHLGLITTRRPIEHGALAVGSALERIWLEAHRRGLAFQPFAGAPLLALPDYRDVSPQVGDALRRGFRMLTDETPVMAFRMGWAQPMHVRAGRPRFDVVLAGQTAMGNEPDGCGESKAWHK